MSDPVARRIAAGALLFAALAGGLRAQSTLFYLELQAVGAYSTASDALELFSLMPDDAMQKPSLGFDFIHRFSGKTRDIGTLAVQARLVYDQEGDHKLQPQLYNAYFRLKTKPVNIWIGHSRPALGLSSVLDGHALLLPAPAMLGYGFDRDWGIGVFTPGTSKITCYRYRGPGGPAGSGCSYFAPLREMSLAPGTQAQYEVYLTIGKTEDIRERFKSIFKVQYDKGKSLLQE